MKARPYHHGDLRATLLALAEATLRDRGPGELSLRELAREAGVSPAAPSRHFRTKQALLDALALEGFDRVTTAMTKLLAETGDSFAERIGALTRAYLTFAIANAALLDLMFSRKHDPEASAELVAAPRRLLTLATDILADGQRQGAVRAGEIERLAVPLFAALQGLTGLAVSAGFTAEQIDESIADMVVFVLRGYAP
ncbi:TetR/AcrR family transcriptional regulator [Actinoplanes sp. NPDC051851]|uniref:TetR/AcrR family transcriptional regulator n=1 Tax=Actinoplanes sp. NPDC051851 TaxID=3154753 RepID=UPI00343B3408